LSNLFKKCPSCGRRFEVKHTGEVLLKSEKQTETIQTAHALSSPTNPYLGSGYDQDRGEVADSTIDIQPGNASVATGTEEVTVEEDTYQESYKCSHCGYEWTEDRVKDKALGPSGS